MRMTKKIIAFVLAGVIASATSFGSAEMSRLVADVAKDSNAMVGQTIAQGQAVTEAVADSDFAEVYTVEPLSISEESLSVDDFSYEEKEDGLYITGYLGSATSVIIPAEIDGKKVVGIGDRAFFGCSNLTSVTLPDSVTQIGERAFSGCRSLTSITIPDGVTQIGSFWGCSSLISIIIPDGVTQIEDGAFGSCSSLTSITIPESVTQIGDRAFSYCSSLTSITIPENVTQIGDETFHGCSNLTSITIPESVEKIADSAFSGCNNLNTFVVEENNPSYRSEDGILYDKNRTKVILCPEGRTASVVIPDGVTQIEDGAFSNCNSLTSIIMSNSVTEIGSFAFSGCGNLKNVAIPDSVTTISYQAFSNCSSFSNINIPSSVTKIDRAFDYCSNLREIDVDESNINYKSIDGILYNKDCTELICCPGGRMTPVTIPNSILKIGDCAFLSCDNLTGIMISENITKIGDYAFRDCRNLTSIKISDSVMQIGEGAFSYCSSLTSITIPDSVTQIAPYTFVWCKNLTDIMISSNVTIIGNNAFHGCSNLTSITMPNSVMQIGDEVFFWCESLEKVYYKGSQEQWEKIAISKYSHIPEKIIFVGANKEPQAPCDFTYLEKDDGLYITGYTGQDTIITIPNQIEGKKVVGIADKAFAGCSTLENVTLPDTLLSIGVRAFEGCNRLKSIIIPDSVTQIRQSAFIGCSDLTSITIPDSVMQIGGEAFSDTGYWDEDANWEDGALYIGTHLIETNPEIAPDYVVKEGTTTISLCDFQYITSLTIPDSVKYLGCEEPDRYLVMEEDRLPKVTVYYKGTQEQWNQIVIDESQGAPKEVVYTKASISYGDATGDQIIDMKDVVLLRKYMAEFDYDSNTSTVAVAAGGDVNGDGIFDMKDVVLLRKYIADFDYDTGSSGVVLGP